MTFKIGNLVEFKDDGGYDIGVITYVDAIRIKIMWFEYECKEYHYLIDNNSLKRFIVVA